MFGPKLVQSALQSTTPKDTFVSLVETEVGQHGFMYFSEINFGAWLSLFSYFLTWKPANGNVVKAKRFVLGNPLYGVPMFKWDMNAGLYAPPELMLVEEEDGGCRVVYQLPSGLIAGYEGAGEELKKAAQFVDEK
jgi:hypothetical protein